MRLLLLALLTFGWLLPFVWAGSTLGRLPFRVPARLWQQYNAAALFTKRTSTWSERLIEVRMAENRPWQRLDMSTVSPMPASGYRQRLDRILSNLQNKKTAESMRRRLAGWIAQQVGEQTGQQLTGVRFLRRSWRVNTPEMAFPAGAWERAEAPLPATTRETLTGTYNIVAGVVTPAPAQPPAPARMPTPKIFGRNAEAQLSQ